VIALVAIVMVVWRRDLFSRDRVVTVAILRARDVHPGLILHQ
jgi:hypothetical protein